MGNILKYAQRYGKKDGKNKKDLMKVIHYAIIQLSQDHYEEPPLGSVMAENKQGSIINISSIYGLVSPDQKLYEYRRKNDETFYKPIAYSASKSGIFNLTRYLAVYWAKENVRVNTLTIAGVFNNQDSSFLQSYCERIPIGRMANPDDYFGPILFLASRSSQYVTGHNLIADGGWTSI